MTNLQEKREARLQRLIALSQKKRELRNQTIQKKIPVKTVKPDPEKNLEEIKAKLLASVKKSYKGCWV